MAVTRRRRRHRAGNMQEISIFQHTKASCCSWVSHWACYRYPGMAGEAGACSGSNQWVIQNVHAIIIKVVASGESTVTNICIYIRCNDCKLHHVIKLMSITRYIVTIHIQSQKRRKKWSEYPAPLCTSRSLSCITMKSKENRKSKEKIVEKYKEK